PLCAPFCVSSHFSFTAPPTTEIYTLSLHDALPIYGAHHAPHLCRSRLGGRGGTDAVASRTGLDSRVLGHRSGRSACERLRADRPDRKSTRLNSSHVAISYAVFCLKKKKKMKNLTKS